ncbi:TonB-dependent receptor [Temperatibacter marinus]|uniref:TonB-dependent receptor n=1 Tax=Temperatibacter marinus TaxID=1456591 RepID=A0AA52EES2_9PROT|nr:TonB-dependent receptor [Temperatibacter marinus]WND01480.1 TonB-dependent receptor [Temperatibacter marinus]
MRDTIKETIAKASVSTAMLLTLAVTGAHGAIAQDSDEKKKGSAASILEEIEVYGTKRSSAEKAQDVAAQISAYGSDKLEAMKVVRLTDLSMSTPSVTLDDIGTVPGTANYSIRGMGVNSSIPTVEPSVALFVNGAYVGAGQGAILSMVDMESVEIHKGPQGVLFGRNVTGGALLLRTARPTDDFSVKGSFGLETGLMKTTRFAVSGALSDSLSARMAFYMNDDNGYFNNDTLGFDIGREFTWVMRPTITFKPSDDFDLTVIYEHGETEGDGPVDQFAQGGNTREPFDTLTTRQDFAGKIDLRWDQLTVEANMAIGEGTLTNIFSYREVDQDSRSDIDGSHLWLFHSTSGNDSDILSNELRYNTRVNDTWEVTAGVYYSTSDLDYDEGRSLFQDASLNFFARIGAIPRVEYGGGGVQSAKNWGIFVNNYVDVNEDLTLQFGGRYSWNEKEGVLNPLTTCTFDYTCFVDIDLTFKSDNFSPKIGLDYDLSDTAKVYTHWSRSYRAGGFNFRMPLSLVQSKLAAGQDLAFDDERVDNFEVGFKSDLMDRKLRLNGAIYVNYLSDMQREINLPDPNGGVLQDIENTGDARILGLEFDAIALVGENTALNFGIGYIDGKYTDIIYDLTGDGVVTDADLDLDIPRLAKWTLTAGITHDVNVADYGVLTLRGEYSYRSKSAYTDNNAGLFNSYSMMNASVDFAPNDANWKVSLYAKNLTDESVLGGMTVLPFAIPALGLDYPYFAPMGKGRRYGAEISYSF